MVNKQDKSKDLAKLSKKEILKIMLAQGEEIDRLRAEVSDLEQQLADIEISKENAGSLAEAALAVTGVFESADMAAKLYLDNIRRHDEDCGD